MTLHWLSIGIPLVFNWHSIGSQLTFHWKSIDIPLAVNRHSLGSPVPLDCLSIGGQLALQWHSIVGQLAHWRWIGRLQTRPTTRIWPKPRLLIGQELKTLASHWSRGPSENFQGGYPYDPEPVPIERYRPQLALDWFISGPTNRPLASIEASERLANLYLDESCTIEKMSLNWHSIGTGLVHLGSSRFISANRSLVSIEASKRLSNLQMNPINLTYSIGHALALHWLI